MKIAMNARRASACIGIAALIGLCLAAPGQQKSEATGAWKRYTLATARLSAELPVDPTAAGVQIRDQNAKPNVAQGPKFSINGVIFRFSYSVYPDGSEVDIERAAQGAISSLMGTTGVTELKFSRTDLKMNGISAIRLETTYQFQARPVSFWILIAGEKDHLWQASAMFRNVPTEQEPMVRRVIGSIQLVK